MTKFKKQFIVLSGLLVLVLAGCGLSSEPEIAAEIPLPTVPPEVTAPLAPPDLTAGAAFYAEHCAVCHGVGGQGDGEMVRDGRLQGVPPDFTDPATMQDQTPLEYMRAVTEGNTLAGMPPFARYSEAERWDAVAYVYTGAITAEQLTLGATVYETTCAECHGPEGQGDGPDAAEIMPDFSMPAFWAERSNADLLDAVESGINQGMPAFADELSAEEITAVVGFVRTLAVNGTPGFATGEAVAEAPAPQATEEVTAAEPTQSPESAADEPAPAATEEVVAEATATPEVVTVRGQVTNGTEGGTVPDDLTVTLHMFDPPEFTEHTLEAAIDADGAYAFNDVPFLADRAYLLSLQYNDVFFSSTIYTGQDFEGDTLQTDLEIFERTNDPSVVHITAGAMRVTFSHFGMEVAEVFSVENTSDRIFLTDEIFSGDQRIALRFPLPPGAGGVGFEPGMEGTRFFISGDGSTVIDTQPLRPGRDDIFFSYLIPYEDGAIIEQEFLYPYTGEFHLLIEADQVSVESPIFQPGEQRVDMGGQPFDSYIADLDLAPGEVLSYTLMGTPDAVAANQELQQGSSEGGLSPVVLILLIVGLLFIGAGGFMFLLRQGGDPIQREIDDLIEQIADLDDQHDQGMLNHDYYQRTRSELKARLADLMRERSGEDES